MFFRNFRANINVDVWWVKRKRPSDEMGIICANRVARYERGQSRPGRVRSPQGDCFVTGVGHSSGEMRSVRRGGNTRKPFCALPREM